MCPSLSFPSCLSWITVEPALFLYMFASNMLYSATQALTLTKVCLLEFNNSTVCDRLGHDQSSLTMENLVQSKASLWIFYANLSLTLPSIITTAFIGSWGDRFDRKLPVLLPCIGAALSTVSYLLNSLYITLPLPWLLVGPLVNSFTGGYITMLMGCFSYVAHITDGTSRTARISILVSMTHLSSAIGVLVFGVLLDNVTFKILFCIGLGILFVAGIYVSVFVRKVTPESDTPVNKNISYFSLNHIKDSSTCLFKTRANSIRLQVWLLMLIILILMICRSGRTDTILLFVKHSPLSWSYSLYGYLHGLRSGLRGLSLLLLLPFLKKMGVGDITLIFFGLISRVSSLIIIGFSTQTWMVFLAGVVSILGAFPSTGCRSIISTLVGVDEQGKIFGALASLESLSSLLASLIFNNIYSVTESFYIGLVYHIMAGLTFTTFFMLLVVFLKSRSTHEGYDPVPEENNIQDDPPIKDRTR